MGVALRCAFVLGRRDGCRVSAWRILGRTEWQTGIQLALKINKLRSAIASIWPRNQRMVRSRSASISRAQGKTIPRRQVSEVERHQVEVTFAGNTREARALRLRAFSALARYVVTESVEQRHERNVRKAGHLGRHHTVTLEDAGVESVGDVPRR